MSDEIPESIINAHIAYDKLIGALASISLLDKEDLEEFRKILEKKIPDVIRNDDFIESQTLYFVLKNVHKNLKGLDE